MTKEDLSFVAEALLALCESDRNAPFHTERRLALKMRLDALRPDAFASLLSHQDGGDPLAEDEVRDVFASAALTPTQSEVVLLRLDGLTFDEIGSERGHTKQGAQRVFLQALKKLSRAFDVYPYTGLSEVYRSEVRRGLKRPYGTMHR